MKVSNNSFYSLIISCGSYNYITNRPDALLEGVRGFGPHTHTHKIIILIL